MKINQLKIKTRFIPGKGWMGEVWTNGGELRYTASVFPSKAEAMQAAMEYRHMRRGDKRGDK